MQGYGGTFWDLGFTDWRNQERAYRFATQDEATTFMESKEFWDAFAEYTQETKRYTYRDHTDASLSIIECELPASPKFEAPFTIVSERADLGSNDPEKIGFGNM